MGRTGSQGAICPSDHTHCGHPWEGSAAQHVRYITGRSAMCDSGARALVPVERCRHTLDFLAVVRDTSVADRVSNALDELEAACPDRERRTAALSRLLDQVRSESPSRPLTPFRRFLIALIERRQSI